MVPLHLHTLWIALVYLFLFVICVLSALVIIGTYGWTRWRGNLGPSHNGLVILSRFGILLSGIFWVSIPLLLVAGFETDIFSFLPAVVIYSVGFSSSGLAGGYVLWKLRETKQPVDSLEDLSD